MFTFKRSRPQEGRPQGARGQEAQVGCGRRLFRASLALGDTAPC